MEMMATKLRADIPVIAQAQAEVYWMAFQSLSPDAQLLLCERLLVSESSSSGLAVELVSWRAAASEALLNFEAMLDDRT